MRTIAGALRRVPEKLLFRTALVFVTAIAVAGAAYAVIYHVRARAVESRQAVAATSDFEAQVHHQSALEWHEIADQRTAHVTSKLRLVRSEVRRSLAALERLDNDADDGNGFRPLYDAYDTAVEQQLRLVHAGMQERAELIEQEHVEPNLAALQDLIREERAEHQQLANRRGAQAQAGTAGTLLVAAILVALFFCRREHAQLVLRRLTRQNESILNAAGEGIIGIGADGRISFVNPAGCRMTGFERHELIGRGTHETIHHSRPDGTPRTAPESPVATALLEATTQQADDGVFWRKDGSSFPVEYTITPMREGDDVTGAVVVFKDITDRREVERTKDEFTSVVSHELRTPLTSIRGSLGLLESGVLGTLPPKGQRMVEIAVQNTDRLVRLINDILDIERITSGMIEMHRERCDAAALIERAADSVAQLAADAGVSLIAEAEPVALYADPDRVLQTLTNLISNAVKFSPPSSTVRVSSKRQDQEVLFEVSDRGRGIPADKLDSIFERFQQVDASDSREKGGTGLGLAICRTIVEHHNGRIWVDSELGRGSSFSFALPAASEETPTSPEARADEGPLVLVCDDDDSVVEVIAAMLEHHGYRAIAAHSGEQALRHALAERPDAILLDLLMPGMSGWETAAALKEHPETGGIPIVIMSVLPEADTEAPGGSVSDWLEKPLDETALLEALDRAVNGRGEPLKVLIVEDDPDIAAILGATFERHGIGTFHAVDGGEAIELSQQILPDMLVLDIGLPDIDGFEVVDWLRRHRLLSGLPMVVYTARDLDEADRERLRLGATVEFLTKGRITPQEFEQRVMRLLSQLTRTPTPETTR